ncbi:MAG: ComF family protein [Armatimonadota bacterium]|nr:ComF family protein [Armatimonadota bacterium]
MQQIYWFFKANNILKSAKEIFSGFLDLIYPPKCVVCGELNPLSICQNCFSKFEPIPKPYCRRCGHTLVGSRCRNCSGLKRSFAAGRAAGQYAGNLREAICRFKYNGMRMLAEPLSRYMHGYLETQADFRWRQADCIVPVPIHPIRRRLRGYNQSELLAEHLSRLTGKPLVSDALVRIIHTRPQVELGPEERRINVRNAFAVKKRGAIEGKTILLVDDVATTCSTVDECSITLLKAGACRVYFLCVAFGA